jgi:prophage regulatory protein
MTASLPVKPLPGYRRYLNNRKNVFCRFSGLKTRHSDLSGVLNLCRLTHRDPHMPTHAPKKYLISHTSLQQCFDKSRSGLEKLRENDPSFPRPIKFGSTKQAGVYFVVAEVEAWLEGKISERDGVTRALSERAEQ